MMLIDTPKSHIACINWLLPNLQGTENIPGSVHFLGNFFWRTTEIFSPIVILSLSLTLCLFVHSSFKNLAYLGICLIVSRSGMFISTCLKTLSIAYFSATLRFLVSRAGNGGGIVIYGLGIASIFFSTPSMGCLFRAHSF